MNRSTRRRFIATLGVSAFGAAPGWAHAASSASRSLQFENLHTGEKLAVEYYQAQRYVPDALAAVNHLLRDFRTGDVGVIDPVLLDLLQRLATLTGSVRPYQIISGYRSSVTNAALRQRSGGVASKSLHLRGQAIDIRLADVPLGTLRDVALSMRAGGVGYYADSNFVHVDCGRVRAW